MKTRAFTFAIVAAALVAGALALAACGGSAEKTAATADIQVLAPSEFKVADYAGKPLVVNFFGSWCGPCNAEAPELSRFAKGNTDTGFVGIAVNDTQGDAVAFMTKYGLEYPLVLDDNSLSADYGITGVPTTIFFDAQGQEKDRIVGAASYDQFTASLNKAQ